MRRCDKMIINLGCAEFYTIMAVVILLIMLPVAAWIIRRQLNKSKKHKQTPVAPLMYITAVSTNRMADIDVPNLPSPGDATFLPPSYEEIVNGVDNQAYLSSSSMTINMDQDELPDYLTVTSNPTGVGSNRGSMVLSTFYSTGDNHSNRRSTITDSVYSETESEDETSDNDTSSNSQDIDLTAQQQCVAQST